MKSSLIFLLTTLLWVSVGKAQADSEKQALIASQKLEKLSSKSIHLTERMISEIVVSRDHKAQKTLDRIENKLEKLLHWAEKLQSAAENLTADFEKDSPNLDCGTGFILVHADFGRRTLVQIRQLIKKGEAVAAGSASSVLHNSLLSIRTLTRSILLELVQGPERSFCCPV